MPPLPTIEAMSFDDEGTLIEHPGVDHQLAPETDLDRWAKDGNR
jgi:hypothetical protein